MEKAKLKFWVGQSLWSDAFTSQVINQKTCFVDNVVAKTEARSLRESNIRLQKTVEEIAPYIIDRLSKRNHALIQTDDSQDHAKLQELKEKLVQMKQDKHRQHMVIKTLGSIAHQQLEQIFENRVRLKVEAQIRREGLPNVLMVDQTTSEHMNCIDNYTEGQSQLLEVEQPVQLQSEEEEDASKNAPKGKKTAEKEPNLRKIANRHKGINCSACGKSVRSDHIRRHQGGRQCRK